MSADQSFDIQAFLDERKVGVFHWLVLVICLAVMVLNGFDVVSLGFVAPAIAKEWSVSNSALAPVMTAVLFGLALGAIFGGPLADKFGRRSVLLLALVFFGVTSFASAWSSNIELLSIMRFLTGLGLGASQPNAATLISEYAPARWRARFMTIVYCGFTIGAAASGLISAGLLERQGWQSVLILGGLAPLVLAAICAPLLPESARFLAVKPDRKSELLKTINRVEAGVVGSSTRFFVREPVHANASAPFLVISGRYLSSTLALWLGLFMNMLVIFLLNSWLPIMIGEVNFSIADAALIGAMMQVGGTVGNVVIGWAMDRWVAHRVVFLFLLAAVALTLALGAPGQNVLSLMLLVFALGFCISSANTGWTVLASIFYPTEMRATGTSWMSSVGFFGAVSGASVGAVLLSAHLKFGQVFMLLSVPTAIAALAALLEGRAVSVFAKAASPLGSRDSTNIASKK